MSDRIMGAYDLVEELDMMEIVYNSSLDEVGIDYSIREATTEMKEQ